VSSSAPHIVIRDLGPIDDLVQLKAVEKQVWQMDEEDAIPLTLAIALKEAGSIFIGAFDAGKSDRNKLDNYKRGKGTSDKEGENKGREKAGSDSCGKEDDKAREKLVGFAFGFLGREHGQTTIHSHMLAVLESYRHLDLGRRLKLAQRERALAMGIREMTWTFDPLQSRNAHFNFAKLGVVSDTYKVDFYGPETSSVLHRNGTDRLWVRWLLDSRRVRERIASATAGATADIDRPGRAAMDTHRGVAKDTPNGTAEARPWAARKDPRGEALDALRLLAPLVRFDGNGRPARSELSEALARERVSIEIPGDILAIEQADAGLARAWRDATRWAFRESLKAGFVVVEYCRSIRGRQGPGAYLLARTRVEDVGGTP
jgi:predicted GNAT superfamily acetyltransferase